MRRFIFYIILNSLSLGVAHAELSTKFKNYMFEDHATTMESFILGRTCFSLRASSLGIDCNPAFLAGSDRRELNFSVVLDDKALEAFKYLNELRDNNSVGVVNRLLSDQRPFAVQQSATIYGQYDWFAVALTPVRLGVASAVVNSSYPTVSTHAMLQSEVSLRAGSFFEEDTNLSVGANLRLVRTHQVRNEFDLGDAISNPELISINETDHVYLDPAVSYRFNGSWDAELTAALTHLALFESDGANVLDEGPRPEIGFASRPDIGERRLRTALHFTGRPDIERVGWRLRFGAIYDLSEDFTIHGTLAGEEYGLGFMARIDSVILGLGVRSEAFYLNGTEVDRLTRALFQAGLTF